MARQVSAEGPQKAEGLSRTTILILAWFLVGMTTGIPAPYHVLCVAGGLLSVVVYLGLELAAFQRAASRELAHEEDAQPELEEGDSLRREQRRALRYAVPPEQQEATLKVGQAKIQVRLVNVSSGGFGVWVERDPGVEAGQVVWIRTDAGWDEVRVVEALEESEGFRLRLQICSAVKPWSHVRQEQYRKVRLRGLRQSVRLPLVGGTLTAVVIVLAPHVRNALLSHLDRRDAVVTNGAAQRAVVKPKRFKEPGPLAQPDRSLPRGGASDGAGDPNAVVIAMPESAKSPVAEEGARNAERGTRSERGTKKFRAPRSALRALPAGERQEDPSLPASGERPHPTDEVSSIRLKLTEAINSVLKDLEEQSGARPLLVQAIRGEVEPGPDASGAAGASSTPATPPDRDHSKSLATFDRGLQRFWRAEYERAIAAFRQAAAQWPDDPTYHYFLALSQYLTGQREQAEQSLAAAVALEAQHTAPDLGRLLQRVQGAQRRWLQAARIKGQVGPYRGQSRAANPE